MAYEKETRERLLKQIAELLEARDNAQLQNVIDYLKRKPPSLLDPPPRG